MTTAYSSITGTSLSKCEDARSLASRSQTSTGFSSGSFFDVSGTTLGYELSGFMGVGNFISGDDSDTLTARLSAVTGGVEAGN